MTLLLKKAEKKLSETNRPLICRAKFFAREIEDVDEKVYEPGICIKLQNKWIVFSWCELTAWEIEALIDFLKNRLCRLI